MRALPLAIALALAASLARPAAAEEPMRCFNRNEQRTAIAEGRAVPLARVRQTVHERTPGELVRARLCQESNRLIYLLTVLARDGKVMRVTVDATNGTVIGGL
jgi:uncharacterized membrane protein YkoI